MSRFTSILMVSPYADGRSWYLRSDFGYDVGAEGSGETVRVPAGFSTDFASIPRPFWIVLPQWGRYGNAAVIHDFLYFDQSYTRRRSDAIFFEAMGVLRVPAWQKYPIWLGVRLFGWFIWYWTARKKASGYSKLASARPEKATELPRHWHLRPGEIGAVLLGRTSTD